jgi:SAM-dependent methyltransferase
MFQPGRKHRRGPGGSSPVAAFRQWAHSPLGETLLAAERRSLAASVPSAYYPLAVQIGLANVPLLDDLDAGRRLYVDRWSGTSGSSVVADWSAIPLAPGSFDLVVLPHILELVDNPHEVLREVDGTVASNGIVVVTGFNPLSLWGIGRLARHWSGRPPWSGRILGARRMQDWMALLDFEIVGGAMTAYRPPVQNRRFLERTEFLEKAGSRWWPAFSACYVIVARKRRIGVRLVPSPVRVRRRWSSGLAQPFVLRCRTGRVTTGDNHREVA